MKSLILTAAISFIAVAAIAQGRYYTLQECGRDSLKYIERNYEDNQFRYIGKTMAYFVDECELTLEDFLPSIFTPVEGTDSAMAWKVDGIFFNFYQDDYRYTVLLSFSAPYPYKSDDFYQIENSDYAETWKPVYYNFFKDFKIDKIYVIKRKDGKTLKNYRRP